MGELQAEAKQQRLNGKGEAGIGSEEGQDRV